VLIVINLIKGHEVSDLSELII